MPWEKNQIVGKELGDSCWIVIDDSNYIDTSIQGRTLGGDVAKVDLSETPKNPCVSVSYSNSLLSNYMSLSKISTWAYLDCSSSTLLIYVSTCYSLFWFKYLQKYHNFITHLICPLLGSFNWHQRHWLFASYFFMLFHLKIFRYTFEFWWI